MWEVDYVSPENGNCRNFDFSKFKLGNDEKQGHRGFFRVGIYCLSMIQIDRCAESQVVKTQAQIMKIVFT